MHNYSDPTVSMHFGDSSRVPSFVFHFMNGTVKGSEMLNALDYVRQLVRDLDHCPLWRQRWQEALKCVSDILAHSSEEEYFGDQLK